MCWPIISVIVERHAIRETFQQKVTLRISGIVGREKTVRKTAAKRGAEQGNLSRC